MATNRPLRVFLRHSSNDKPAVREKYKINRTRRMLVWDPIDSEINEEIRIEDYLGPMKAEAKTNETAKVVREKKGTYKTGKKKK